jgi:hypothetical protein
MHLLKLLIVLFIRTRLTAKASSERKLLMRNKMGLMMISILSKLSKRMIWIQWLVQIVLNRKMIPIYPLMLILMVSSNLKKKS